MYLPISKSDMLHSSRAAIVRGSGPPREEGGVRNAATSCVAVESPRRRWGIPQGGDTVGLEFEMGSGGRRIGRDWLAAGAFR
jgi:hypothetical protein